MKRTAIAILTVLAVAGCGGKKADVASTTATSAPAPSAPTTSASAPAATTPPPTTTASTTHSATQAAPATTPSTRTGGSAPTPQTTTTTSTSGHLSPTPAQIAAAKAALPRCQENEPGITLAQLEQEAASPLGIQC